MSEIEGSAADDEGPLQNGAPGLTFTGPCPASADVLLHLVEASAADFALLSTTLDGRPITAGVVARSKREAFRLLAGGSPEAGVFRRVICANDGSSGLVVIGASDESRHESSFARSAEAAIAELTAKISQISTLAWPVTRRAFGPDRLRLLESVVVHAKDAVLITEAYPIDEPGPRVIYVNEAFEQMTGHQSAAIVGKTPRMVQGPLTSNESKRAMRKALERWQPLELEVQNYRADGSTFWVELSLVPVADETGWYRHWISIQRDVSTKRGAAAIADQAEFMRAQNVIMSAEIASRKEAESRLEHFAFYDDLTGLRNRAYFIERLTRALSNTDRNPAVSFAVLFFDLDRFKIINDSLGHSAGDRLLREVGVRIRECIRGSDVAARMGGDEFAVLVENIAGEAFAVELADRVVEALREPVAIGDIAVTIQASIGVAFRSVDGTTPEAVLRDADIAMYRAKESGGNRSVVFDEAMHAKALHTFQLHADLERALTNDEIVVYYQPIVELATGSVRGFEALARWNHPTRGLVSPDEFIPAAEETGIIVRIGNCVLRKALFAVLEWQQHRPTAALRVSVNVSPVQLQDALFLDSVSRALAEAGVSGSVLELEITEGVFFDNTVRAATLFASLHDLGVTIAIDDFGTGYSSLGYLQRYAIDVLKIDRSFIASVADSPRNAALVRNIIGLGRDLGMKIVAEGIETVEQQSILVDSGCHLAQGYYYSEPLHPAAVTPYLDKT